MFEFQEKRKFKSIVYSYPVVVVVFILVAVVGRSAWGVYQKEQESARNLLFVRSELKTLEERKAFLQEEVERLKTDQGIENEIRHKFQVAKDGESIVVIVPEAIQKEIATSTVERIWWKFWK